MKTLYACLLCAAGMQLITAGTCSAQLPASPLKIAPATVAIDGVNQEWGDTLSYHNTNSKIRYTISNDKDNLYLVVKAKDPIEESNILVGGLTFTIDTKGRKKSSYTVTFPSNGETQPAFVTKAGEEPLEQKATRAKYLRFKKIEVDGFKDIDDKYITTSNTNGIKVAASYDDQGYLIYEEAIPLALFHAGDLMKGDWAYNIKLNGIDRPEKSPLDSGPSDNGGGGGGGRGGKGGGRKAAPDASAKASTTGPLTQSVDFWGKFSLAK